MKINMKNTELERSRPMAFWSTLSRGALAIGAVATLLFAATNAQAGCGTYPGLASKGTIKPASFVLGSSLLAADWNFGREDASIVGLWRVKVLSTGNEAYGLPDGTPLDQGYSVWHSDGTEILNSGRDPMTGSFCLGVWKQVGRFSYKLNHYALNWTGITLDAKGNIIVNPPNTLVGPTNIREEVTIDPSKDTFQGSFTVENFDQNGNSKIRLTGQITGVRLTPDSPNYVP